MRPSSSSPSPMWSAEMTTTVFFCAAGTVQEISSSPLSATAPSVVMVTQNSFSPRFSVRMAQPLLSARRVRFCTAISLSTSVCTVPAPFSSCSACSVFTTGIGHASPIAFTSIIKLPPSGYSAVIIARQCALFQSFSTLRRRQPGNGVFLSFGRSAAKNACVSACLRYDESIISIRSAAVQKEIQPKMEH